MSAIVGEGACHAWLPSSDAIEAAAATRQQAAAAQTQLPGQGHTSTGDLKGSGPASQCNSQRYATARPRSCERRAGIVQKRPARQTESHVQPVACPTWLLVIYGNQRHGRGRAGDCMSCSSLFVRFSETYKGVCWTKFLFFCFQLCAGCSSTVGQPRANALSSRCSCLSPLSGAPGNAEASYNGGCPGRTCWRLARASRR